MGFFLALNEKKVKKKQFYDCWPSTSVREDDETAEAAPRHEMGRPGFGENRLVHN